MAGYFFHSYPMHLIKLRKMTILTAWISAITFLALHVFIKPHYTSHTSLLGFLYESVWRELWTLSICWIVFACQYLESGGIIRWFLSLSLWQPLSRMSLSIYLINFVYIKLTLVNQKSVPDLDSWWQMHIYTADIVLAVIFGGILYLAVEAPTMRLINFFWSLSSKEEWKKVESDENQSLLNDAKETSSEHLTPPDSLLMLPSELMTGFVEDQSSDEDGINYFKK